MLIEIIQKMMSLAFGLGIVVGLMSLVGFRSSFRWRYLADHYGPPADQPTIEKQFQNAILYGHGVAYNSYNGIVTIGVLNGGIALRLFKPFSFFHKPLFIPFTDIKGWKQRWFLNTPSIELEFAKAPDVKVVMPKDQVDWLHETMDASLSISGDLPPENKRPDFSYASTLALGGLSLMTGAMIIASLLGLWPG